MMDEQQRKILDLAIAYRRAYAAFDKADRDYQHGIGTFQGYDDAGTTLNHQEQQLFEAIDAFLFTSAGE